MEKRRYAPVIAGNYADPSVIRVGEDYYMTHSSYKLTPGLIIWHSRDLLNWSRVGAALPRYEGDVWAPDFVEHNGVYYIYYPAGRTNWVVTAPSPAGPWSKPINLGIKGIDPGHTAGPDGKRYLHMSGGDCVELTADGLAIAGEIRHVYDGWRYPDDWVVEAYSLEGPKITLHNGYYYLTVAVGGTAGPPTSHMAVSSRSRTPSGPWEHSPYNPIVHTESRSEPWWSKGHVSLIDSPGGQWWMVYHAYANGFHSLGRQTLLEPVEWTPDGWFRAAGSRQGIDHPDDVEGASPADAAASFLDTFDDSELGLHWQCEGVEPAVRFRSGNHELVAEAAAEEATASPLLYMAGSKRYSAEVEVVVEGPAEGRLLLYYNDEAYLGMGVNEHGVRHFRSFKGYGTMPNHTRRAFLRLVNDAHTVFFYYSFDGLEWMRYDKVVDVSGFHHNTFGGFQSLRIGLDAVGKGKVIFRNFSYNVLSS
ncbi:family 43 glycosylhydrolase [Paenibacillus glucanolyticus]|uniref:family 43 glycosylhydrolase n=1 Tax=Paenibacillus glucanolyticus TaxID=59843 RepID=UPI00096BDF52|nr:family 43 glycosylhydrolase [Paenibacillus glucanolyticus]OMF74217.1 xylan 1,4-beta-xylosidase [Paenibacillus glucanolyticus]